MSESPTLILVDSQLALNQAIVTADAATSGAFVIQFTGDITAGAELYALNLASGVTVTIDGAGHALDGADTYRGLFVHAGTVTIQDLTIQNTVARGGAGGSGTFGGGAGLGGGLFVAGTTQGSGGANVTLDNVAFIHNAAIDAAAINALPAGGARGSPPSLSES